MSGLVAVVYILFPCPAAISMEERTLGKNIKSVENNIFHIWVARINTLFFMHSCSFFYKFLCIYIGIYVYGNMYIYIYIYIAFAYFTGSYVDFHDACGLD